MLFVEPGKGLTASPSVAKGASNFATDKLLTLERVIGVEPMIVREDLVVLQTTALPLGYTLKRCSS